VIGGDVHLDDDTAIEKVASKEDAERRLKTNTGDQPLVVLESVSLRRAGGGSRSGKLLHDIELAERE
jgi:outer membrane protein assembly factor BamB